MTTGNIDFSFEDDDDQPTAKKAEYESLQSKAKESAISKIRAWFWAGIRQETSFNWLKFIASTTIPLSVFWLSFQQVQSAADQQRHAIMSKYLEEMTDLLVDPGLNSSDSNKAIVSNDAEEKKAQKDAVKRMAEAITLIAAGQLHENQSFISKLLHQPNPNSEHKGKLVKFLYQADLIGWCPIADSKKMSVDKANCKPTQLNLSSIKLNGMVMEKPVISLPGIDLSQADLSDSRLSELTFTKAKLQGATLTNTNLSRTVLTDADMQQTILKDADLTEAILIRTNLQGANLKGANLKDANLRGADLRGADLQGADLQGVDLTEAKYDRKTIFPEHVDKQGMLICKTVKEKETNKSIENCI